MRRRLAAVTIAALLAQPAPAQPARPKPPARYDATLRVETRQDIEGRLRDVRAILDSLKPLGFVDSREDPDLEKFDTSANTITGTIPSENAAKMLGVPGVKSVLLTPPGFAPDAANAEIRVTIPGGLDPAERLKLHRQTASLLGRLGFREHVGYDDRQFRLLRGTIPTLKLPDLLSDLRLEPAGWFLPQTLPDELPTPVRDTLPVRIVEVLPIRPAPAPAPVEPPLPPALAPSRAKLSPELTLALAGPDSAKFTRVEALLDREPGGDWPAARSRLQLAARGVSVDGLVGTVVALRVAKIDDLAAVANVPGVTALRVPQVGETGGKLTANAAPDSLRDWLSSTRLGQLHAAGYTGEGTSIAVIAADFPDAARFFGKGLPPATTILDLTAALDPELNPRPNANGIGTAAALAASAAAPGARIVLVRIDPASAFQLLTVARAAGGASEYSQALRQRAEELTGRRDDLAARRAAVERDYARAREDQRRDEGGPARFEAARKSLEALQADEARLAAATNRFQLVKSGLDSLRGTTILYNTLTWPAGYPQDGLSEISRYLETNLVHVPVRTSRRLEAKNLSRPVWIQASSTALGRAWAGPLLDADGDGLLEFTQSPNGQQGEWRHELNFLKYAPIDGKPGETIPAGTKVRVVAQWREPRGAAGITGVPALAFRPRLLRQLDPAGDKLASDEFDITPGITSPPVKLLETANSEAFEQSVELTVPAAGRYALQVHFGPAFRSPFPGLRQSFEVDPRFVLEPVSPGGQVLFASYAPVGAGVGVPGDSPLAVTVGGDDSLSGAGPGVALRVKPDLVAPNRVTVAGVTLEGPAAGAALIAGAAASLAQAGLRADDLARSLGLKPGERFTIPEAWLAAQPARSRR